MQTGFSRAAAGLGVATAACAVIGVQVSAAATPSSGTSGAIQIFSTTGHGAPDDIITGAIADHGTDRTGQTMNFQKIVLTRGTFEIGTGTFNRSYKAKIDHTGCTVIGTLSASGLPILDGTGAYAGISGSVALKATSVDIFSLKNGKCTLSGQPAAETFVVEGTGHVAY